MTPAPSSLASISDPDEQLMHVDFEFSDADAEVEEPIRKRTRSQSRLREIPSAPTEPAPKVAKVRRGAKKVGAEAAAKKPRRRRVIAEEPAELNTDDELE